MLHVGNKWPTSFIHYFSVLSGPILACVCGSFLTLIPIHNVMKQPSYWYENMLCTILGSSTVFVCQQLIRAEYWSNFELEKKLKTYVLVNGLTHILNVVNFLVSAYVWTSHFGFYHPIPLNVFIIASVSVLAINLCFLPFM